LIKQNQVLSRWRG